MSYVKADQDILDSSLWAESSDTRIVWFTLMLMAGADGVVRSTAPGIARRANVSLRATRAALELFERPDVDSRSLEAEGRRIVRVDGGFRLVNYLRYRDKDHTAAARKRRQRERECHAVTRDTVTGHGAARDVTQAEAKAEADTDTTNPPNPPASAGGPAVTGPGPATPKTAARTPTAAGAIADRIAACYREQLGKAPAARLVRSWRVELRQGVTEAAIVARIATEARELRSAAEGFEAERARYQAALERVEQLGGRRSMARAAIEWTERNRDTSTRPAESVDAALRRWAAEGGFSPETLAVIGVELYQLSEHAALGALVAAHNAKAYEERVA